MMLLLKRRFDHKSLRKVSVPVLLACCAGCDYMKVPDPCTGVVTQTVAIPRPKGPAGCGVILNVDGGPAPVVTILLPSEKALPPKDDGPLQSACNADINQQIGKTWKLRFKAPIAHKMAKRTYYVSSIDVNILEPDLNRPSEPKTTPKATPKPSQKILPESAGQNHPASSR